MKNLYVGNLPHSTTEAELRGVFEAHGAVEKVSLVTDRETGRSRGFAFVEMTNPAEADKAIAHAQRVVELEPDDAFSYTALSVIYQRCGRIPEAEHAKAMAWQKQMGFQ